MDVSNKYFDLVYEEVGYLVSISQKADIDTLGLTLNFADKVVELEITKKKALWLREYEFEGLMSSHELQGDYRLAYLKYRKCRRHSIFECL